MKVIQENNIAGLNGAFITENPAKNGLHDVAWSFLCELLQKGKNAWDVYGDLIQGNVSVAA